MDWKKITFALDRLGGKSAVKAIKGGASKETANMISGAIEGGAIFGVSGAITGGLSAAFDGNDDTTIIGGAIKGGLIGGSIGAFAGGAYAYKTGNRKLLQSLISDGPELNEMTMPKAKLKSEPKSKVKAAMRSDGTIEQIAEDISKQSVNDQGLNNGGWNRILNHNWNPGSIGILGSTFAATTLLAASTAREDR